MQLKASLQFLLAFFILIISCNTTDPQNKMPAAKKEKKERKNRWQLEEYNRISFQHPKDWIYQKQRKRDMVLLSVTPDSMIRTLFPPFEILQIIGWKDLPFSRVEKEIIDEEKKRVDGISTVTLKKKIELKGFETMYVEMNFVHQGKSIPAEIYAVNAGELYYIINIPKADPQDEFGEIKYQTAKTILESLVINK